MNIIVDRPKLVRVVLLYLNNNFGDLTPTSYSNIPGKVFYVNKKLNRDSWNLFFVSNHQKTLLNII